MTKGKSFYNSSKFLSFKIISYTLLFFFLFPKIVVLYVNVFWVKFIFLITRKKLEQRQRSYFRREEEL